MKRNYYIFSPGKLIRKDNTLYFEEYPISGEVDYEDIGVEYIESSGAVQEDIVGQETEKVSNSLSSEPEKIPRRPLPVNDIEALFCFAELTFNTRFLNFLAKNQITLHLFNYYGWYTGSFYPKSPFISGYLLTEQVLHYSMGEKRLKLAKLFVLGSAKNILKNLQYYDTRGKDMSVVTEQIKTYIQSIERQEMIPELMGIEGNIRSTYYSVWPLIFNDPVDFTKRERYPPTNPVNSLISFGNSLVYTTVLNEIYKTQLNPLISFLHEPGERRFSLSLDIAEIFKPILADRVVFSLMNKGMLTEKNFEMRFNYCYLSESGKKVFVREFDEKLKTTVRHRKLNRQVSYRQLIRLECYKLIKHILGEQEYEPFVIWW